MAINPRDLFAVEKGNIVCVANYMELYIPEYFYEKGWAVPDKEYTSVFALIGVGVFKDDKRISVEILNLPVFVNLYIYDSESNQSIAFTSDNDRAPEICRVCRYKKGQIIMPASIIEDSENAQSFVSTILKGKIPEYIPYGKLYGIWDYNKYLSKVGFGIPSCIEEMVLAVSCRDANNLSSKFSSVVGKDPSVSQYNYKNLNIRQICQYASTFTGMTFEDINSMITTSVNRAVNKTPEMESPVEKILKF